MKIGRQINQLKIYPCEVVDYTKIKEWDENGTYKPYGENESELIEVIAFIKDYLVKNITSKWTDEFVKKDNMVLFKLILDKVKQIDDNARMKTEHFTEKNKDFWIEGAD